LDSGWADVHDTFLSPWQPLTRLPASSVTKLGELDGFELHMDSQSPDCRGERAYAIAELTRFYGPNVIIAQAIYRMRCQQCGRKPPRAARIVTGAGMKVRGGRPRRLALMGKRRGNNSPGDGSNPTPPVAAPHSSQRWSPDGSHPPRLIPSDRGGSVRARCQRLWLGQIRRHLHLRKAGCRLSIGAQKGS
jgi:hypothetical protein